jgi:transcriptional regulator with XRE-family HTH domain
MWRRRREISQAALDYEAARLPRELTTAIAWYMDNKKPRPVTRSELARRLGVTSGRVSQILSGDENVTLHTVAAVCVALGAQLETRLVDHDGRRDQADQDVSSSDSNGGRRDRHPGGVLSGRR